jgi:hypothetical protein
MLKDIVDYARKNHAYIKSKDSEDDIAFACHHSGMTWEISKEDFDATKKKREKIIINNPRVRAYFCRSVSCKMYDRFEKELIAFIKTKKWYKNLSEDERSYISLVKKFFYLYNRFDESTVASAFSQPPDML